jgi:hypothetical protein
VNTSEYACFPARVACVVADTILKSVELNLYTLMMLRKYRFMFFVSAGVSCCSTPTRKYATALGSDPIGGEISAMSIGCSSCPFASNKFTPVCTPQLDGYCILTP